MPVISQEELDSLIDRGKRLRELTRYFQHRSEALSSYATRQHFHYDLQSAFDQPCCCCQVEPGEVVVEYRWEAIVFAGVKVSWYDLIALPVLNIYLLLFFLFGFWPLPVKFDFLGFRTFHPFCARCRARAAGDETFGNAMDPLALAAFLIAPIVLLFGTGIRHFNLETICWWLGSTLGLVLIGVALLKVKSRLRTPQPLRSIGRHPFHCKAIVPVEDVAAAMLDAAVGPEQHFGVEAPTLRKLRQPRTAKRTPSADPRSVSKPSAP